MVIELIKLKNPTTNFKLKKSKIKALAKKNSKKFQQNENSQTIARKTMQLTTSKILDYFEIINQNERKKIHQKTQELVISLNNNPKENFRKALDSLYLSAKKILKNENKAIIFINTILNESRWNTNEVNAILNKKY